MRLSSSQRLLIILLALGVAGILVAHLQIGLIGALLVALFICTGLWITRVIWLPPGFGATRVRLASLSGVFVLAGSFGVWAPIVNALVGPVLDSSALAASFPVLKGLRIESEPSLAVLLFVLITIFVVNYFLPDRSISGRHPESTDREFPEKDYNSRLRDFCQVLRRQLTDIDRETNWSHQYFTPLDADVEVLSDSGRMPSRRVTDLIGALRRDKNSQAFLVLGDPGAGKSVALRKLALEMLEEVSDTGRVPIYVNLREWLPKAAESEGSGFWTEARKPTVQELAEFVISSVKERSDVFTGEFIDQYFRKMWEHGRLFFVLDSFDEIPSLLDVREDSWLIEELSEVVWKFIAGTPASRGVLASRFFRQPTAAFQAAKVLEVRPLSEEKVVRVLQRYPKFSPALQKQLFSNRGDLIPVARNPFLMALLGPWVEKEQYLPPSQNLIYESYLQGQLARCGERLRKHGLSVENVLTTAREIAWFIFQSDKYGLEAPIAELNAQQFTAPASAVIDVLTYGRIARVGTADLQNFAFVHRRFLEYFVALQLIDTPDCLPLNDIPTDSRGRDALVLFAQVTDDERAESLARYCWSQVIEHFPTRDTRLRAIHCLRFLSDAFRSRLTAIRSFQAELAEFVRRNSSPEQDVLAAKHALEATGLLAYEQAEPIIRSAIVEPSEWLRETAFRACRHVSRPTPALESALKEYVWSIPIVTLIRNRRNLLFSLSLSDGLRGVRRMALYRLLDLGLWSGGILLLFFPIPIRLVPLLLTTPVSVLLFLRFMAFLLRSDEASRDTRGWPLYRIFGGQPRAADEVVCYVRLYSLITGVILLGFFTSVMYLAAQRVATAESPIRNGELLVLSVQACGTMLIMPWVGFVRVITLKGTLQMLWRALRQFVNYGLPGVACLVAIILTVDRLPVIAMSLSIVMAVCAIGTVGYWLSSQLPKLHTLCRDYLTFRKLKVFSEMTRTEITNAVSQLSTQYFRTRYVAELRRHRTQASGNWPESLQLVDRSDAAITELARLEERWLRLDR